MSITNSKRVPIRIFWQFIDAQTQEEILILIGIDVAQSRLVASSNHWDRLPEEWQEKIYNWTMKLGR